MSRYQAGIAYYQSICSEFEALDPHAPERRLFQLTIELLIENEERYSARARYLMDNGLLRMTFGKFEVEYFIDQSLVSFSFSEDEGRTFVSAHTLPLSTDVNSDLETIVMMMAEGEAQLTLRD
ncbi:MAG: hypothetical protein RL414_159 [Actinomycetota bacterium]